MNRKSMHALSWALAVAIYLGVFYALWWFEGQARPDTVLAVGLRGAQLIWGAFLGLGAAWYLANMYLPDWLELHFVFRGDRSAQARASMLGSRSKHGR